MPRIFINSTGIVFSARCNMKDHKNCGGLNGKCECLCHTRDRGVAW